MQLAPETRRPPARPASASKKSAARAEESVRNARVRMNDAGLEFEARVRESPWTAVGAAAGIGVIIGMMLGRK